MMVIDASVAVKWFVTEAASEVAEALISGPDAKAAPSHVLGEVAQALLRHHHARRLSLDYCRLSLARVQTILHLTPVEQLIQNALNISAETRCSIYDALYLAAAERWNATLVTADAKLVNRVDGTRWRQQVRLIGANP